MVSGRHASILEILVREYIKTAEPVSSGKVADHLGNTLSSASIRTIFSDLTDEGYIEQPYTSGGRIPKARGYRFFVDKLLADDSESSAVPNKILRMLAEEAHMMHELHALQSEIARNFRVLSQFGATMPVGFDEVFSEPEFSEPTLMREFGKFLDEFDSYREEYNELLEPDSYQLFIGEENIIQPLTRVSIVVGKNTEDQLFFIAGPTRMPYDQIIHLMKIWKKHPTKTTKK